MAKMTEGICGACKGSGSDPTERQLVIDGVSTTKIVDEDCKQCGGSGRQLWEEQPPDDHRYR